MLSAEDRFYPVPLSTELAKVPASEYKALLSAVGSKGAVTRSELAARSALPRSSVTLRVRELLDAGLLVEMGETEQTGGRRARRVGFAPSTGAVLAI